MTWELTSVDGDFADLVSIKEANIAFRRVSFRLRVPLEQVPVDFGPSCKASQLAGLHRALQRAGKDPGKSSYIAAESGWHHLGNFFKARVPAAHLFLS